MLVYPSLLLFPAMLIWHFLFTSVQMVRCRRTAYIQSLLWFSVRSIWVLTTDYNDSWSGPGMRDCSIVLQVKERLNADIYDYREHKWNWNSYFIFYPHSFPKGKRKINVFHWSRLHINFKSMEGNIFSHCTVDRLFRLSVAALSQTHKVISNSIW